MWDHSEGEFEVSSLGSSWPVIIRNWPEAARLDLIGQLAHKPQLADTVEELAHTDTSSKIKLEVARLLSWHGFKEKSASLFESLDENDFNNAVMKLHPEELPAGIQPRALRAYEERYSKEAQPVERLRRNF